MTIYEQMLARYTGDERKAHQELDIWSNDYFVQVAHLMQIIA